MLLLIFYRRWFFYGAFCITGVWCSCGVPVLQYMAESGTCRAIYVMCGVSGVQRWVLSLMAHVAGFSAKRVRIRVFVGDILWLAIPIIRRDETATKSVA